MSKKRFYNLACLLVPIIGFVCGFCLFESKMDKKYYNYVYPYEEYSSAMSFGDTVSYNNVVAERREKTPSHPDYFDLSVIIAGSFDYRLGYYNAYLALHDLYKYNHFKMGEDVKRLMYGYLQLAIESRDYRVTGDDIKAYHSVFPNGLILE